MKLYILGGTGPTGQHLVSQALEQGHEITALVRTPSKIAFKSPKLTLITPDLFDSGAVAASMKGHQVVVSALGVGMTLRPHDLMNRAMASIIKAMQDAGLKRIVSLSAFGLGESYHQASMLQKVFYKLMLNKIYEDKLRGEVQLRKSNLDWTLVYAVALSNGKRAGKYKVGERLPMKGMPRISRADVADFMLRQINSDEWVRKVPIISN